MERMEELNEKLTEKFFEELKKEGEPVVFSEKEREEWQKKYGEFNEKESKIEKLVRRERVKAAATPDVYLSF